MDVRMLDWGKLTLETQLRMVRDLSIAGDNWMSQVVLKALKDRTSAERILKNTVRVWHERISDEKRWIE